MRTPITLAQLGYEQETARIVTWLKAIGDSVERGEALAEIETDKSTIDMESPATGQLVEIVHGEGEEVAVGTIIAYLEST